MGFINLAKASNYNRYFESFSDTTKLARSYVNFATPSVTTYSNNTPTLFNNIFSFTPYGSRNTFANNIGQYSTNFSNINIARPYNFNGYGNSFGQYRTYQSFARPTFNSANINKPELKLNFKNPFAPKSTDALAVQNYKNQKKSNLPKLQLSTQRLTEMGFNTASKREGWNSLRPEMQRALVELTRYAESKGIKIGYNSKRSIYRTYNEQAQIYKTARKGYAARPGNSRHESGEAVDINILNGNKEAARKILGQYWEKMGYTWGGRWRHTETWHFDMRPKRA